MLAPQIEADQNDPLLEFGLAARDHYDQLAPSLLESTGVDVGLWREGIARVATDPADAATLETKVTWQRRNGLAAEWLQANELKRRWPWLGLAVGALWAPRDGALDPAQLVLALLKDAESHGASVINARVDSVQHRGGRVAGVSAQGTSYSAPHVVVAAGAWSSLIEGTPRPLPVQPVRGQMAALGWPKGVERAILYHRDCYLLARGGEAIVGSTMEHAGYHAEVTSAGLARIFAGIAVLCPGLVRAKVRRSWAGLRPMTPDGLPVIGSEPELEGLWYATGHGRNGILLAGLTGLLLAKLIGGEKPALDLIRFAPDRFPI